MRQIARFALGLVVTLAAALPARAQYTDYRIATNESTGKPGVAVPPGLQMVGLKKTTDGTGDSAISDGSGRIIIATQAAAPLDTNVVKWGGTLVTGGSGVSTAGSPRVILATDDPAVTSLALIDDVPHARNAAFSKAAAIGGELDDIAPVAATEGNVSPLRITAQRAGHVNLRDNAGTEIGLAASPVVVRLSDGTTAQTFDTQDLDSGAGVVTRVTTGLVVAGAGGPIAITGDVANGLDVDVTRMPADATELPAAAALADNTANPTTPVVGAFLQAWDGGNWDRVLTGAGGLLVDTELAPLAAAGDAESNPTASRLIVFPMTYNGTTWDRSRGDTTNGLDVDVTRLPSTTLAAGTLKQIDYDTGAGTDNLPMVGLGLPAAGGAVAAFTSTNPGVVNQGDGFSDGSGRPGWIVGIGQRATTFNSRTVSGLNAAVTAAITNGASARGQVYKVVGRCSAGTATLEVWDGAVDVGTLLWDTAAGGVGTANTTEQWNTPLAGSTNTTVTVRLTACGAGNTGTLMLQGSRF